MLKPTKMKRDDIEGIVSDAIEDAVSFIESEISDERLKAQRYFDGKVDLGHEEGRSKVVATKCRDTVRALKPSLMRVFMKSDKPVEFVPIGPEDVKQAEQATTFAQYVFNKSNGYAVVADAIHDACVKKTGVVKVYYEDKTETDIEDFSGLSEDQFAIAASEYDIIEVGQDEMGLYFGKASTETGKGDVCIESVAPEDFFVNREAKDIDTAYICGHRNTDMRVGDVVAMGYSFDEVIEHAGDGQDTMQDEADFARTGFGTEGDDENAGDPSMKKVMVTEAYMKMDVEGTGIAKLYSFLCLGDDYSLLDYELADEKPFAIFEVDPEPHSFFGRSLVELIIQDQDAATSMLRGLLDNVALTNNPGLIVLDGQVNMEDVLNNEIGAIRRVKSMGAIEPFAIPFIAGTVIPAMQYFDETIENKTGVTRASMGLAPDTLQNTTAAGVNATVEAASGQSELIARNLAEGGMKRLFKLIMLLSMKHASAETMMRLDGQFVPVDPRTWNADMDMIVNVGLGTGGEVEREMVLRETLQWQMQVWQSYGPSNGLVTLTHIRNTMADIQKLGGIQNSDRYLAPMSPELEQMLLQQAAQAAQAQGQPDPTAALAQAEVTKAQIEAQTRMQIEQGKLEQKGRNDMATAQIKAQTANMQDDFKRDEMDMKMAFEAADLLGKYGIQLDQNQIRRLQAMPRQ